MGLCRERLSLSPNLERPPSAAQQQHGSGGREAEQQSQSKQQGPSCPSEGCPEEQKENSEAACQHPRPAPFAPSLLGEMICAFSEANLLLNKTRSTRQTVMCTAVSFLGGVSGVALLQSMMQSSQKGGLLQDCLVLCWQLAESIVLCVQMMAWHPSCRYGRAGLNQSPLS